MAQKYSDLTAEEVTRYEDLCHRIADADSAPEPCFIRIDDGKYYIPSFDSPIQRISVVGQGYLIVRTKADMKNDSDGIDQHSIKGIDAINLQNYIEERCVQHYQQLQAVATDAIMEIRNRGWHYMIFDEE